MGKGGGRAHTPVEVKDNLKSTQMMSVIDAIGEGPIEGPVKGLQSILVNNSWVRERSSTLCRDWPGPERVDCRLCWGRQPSWGRSSRPGHQWRYGVQPWQPVVFLPPRCCFHWGPA